MTREAINTPDQNEPESRIVTLEQVFPAFQLPLRTGSFRFHILSPSYFYTPVDLSDDELPAVLPLHIGINVRTDVDGNSTSNIFIVDDHKKMHDLGLSRPYGHLPISTNASEYDLLHTFTIADYAKLKQLRARIVLPGKGVFEAKPHVDSLIRGILSFEEFYDIKSGERHAEPFPINPDSEDDLLSVQAAFGLGRRERVPSTEFRNLELANKQAADRAALELRN